MKGSVFIAASIDGFIARENGDIDWLPEAPEDHGYDAFIKTIDVIVMGRGTYEKVLTFGTWPFTKPVVVLSSRVLSPPPANAPVSFMSGDPADVAARLTTRGFTRAYVDGGITVQRFLTAGLIDRMIITRIPVIIGAGIPLFGPTTRDVRLDHVRTTAYPSGLVQSEYIVKPPPM